MAPTWMSMGNIVNAGPRLWRPWRWRRHGLAGYLDGVRDAAIRGWVFEAARPNRPLQIHLAADNGVNILARADRYRGDVRRSGKGDGHCGFAIPLRAIGDATNVRCLLVESGLELPGSPVFLAKAVPAVSRHVDGTVLIGVDSFWRGQSFVAGYVVDRADIYRRHRLALVADDEKIAEMRATLYREDACSDGGDGFNGFLFRLPPNLKREALAIIDRDTGRPLLRFRADRDLRAGATVQ